MSYSLKETFLSIFLKSLLKKSHKIISILLFSLFLAGLIFAQDTTKSLAFKNNRPYRKSPYFYRPDLGYQIWQQFKLIQEANSGDVLAQHELGLRYLLGDGMSADTVQAVFWIQKAANQKLASAMYNYAILLINGWGVKWNPFSAFKFFREAAKAGMIQAQYVVGILYTDNLIVKRDLNYAYYWIRKSSEEGYEPAAEVIQRIEPKISRSVVDSLTSIEEQKQKDIDHEPDDGNTSNLTSPVGLAFIDFDSIGDTITAISDSMLIADLKMMGIDSLSKEMRLDSIKYLIDLSAEENIQKLRQLAKSGSPEAQTIIGRLYELGIHLSKNKITAAAYYLQALRLDSHKAPYLLWHLSKSAGFYKTVQTEVKINNAEAMFVWYGLNSINYDNQLVISDAVNLLQNSADKNYIPAIIELGLNYYTGIFTNIDYSKGFLYWQKAESMGSTEATVRLITASLLDNRQDIDIKSVLRQLQDAEKNGSVLAQVALAFCYELGIGTIPSKSKAVNYYRNAAQRGSQYAYRELQRLYDEIRPIEPEFSIK